MCNKQQKNHTRCFHISISVCLQMFKFFPDEDEVVDTSGADRKASPLRPCIEVKIRQEHYDLAQETPVVNAGGTIPLNLKYINVRDLLKSSKVTGDPNVKSILTSSSDLVPGLYEGGFKLWECTFDLLSYLEDESGKAVSIGPDTKVLDLGCGHGLLGLYALGRGAHVLFQDYNEEVLTFLTIPNTISNFGDEGLLRARYFAGGWDSINEYAKNNNGGKDWKFDTILSSETIYNMDYFEDFLNLVDLCLKPSGSLYLAAKTCYFGVGGGTNAFTSLVTSDKYNFGINTVFNEKFFGFADSTNPDLMKK
ncbi:histidine protein methyltransferase 1 homolog isoform X3 [Folsomia candida]|uniref:histidine protein methyltransferase 1 homolog isoform X3 n=1 Tax=Folsomia candida TaxID=158441 RepID=UPI00160559CC|nr:histidine protein methyltransferase 1 homolog isoform X3 [Folsomia candida]